MAKKEDKIVRQVRSKAKSAAHRSFMKHPLAWILIILIIVVVLFILTPTENPLSVSLVFDSVSEKLAIPAYSSKDTIVQHTGYTLSYSEEHEQPYWVAYLLTADEVFANGESRNDNFREDPAIPTGSATLSDYRGSGYDRGHLCPAADQSWSAKAMDDSFFLSNMSPQTHNFNAGIWLNLESAVRSMAAQNHEICVVTGPVLTDGPYSTIGANKVSVPKNFYKVILDYYGPEKKAIGFILSQDSKGSLSSYAVSVDEVERVTGIDFFPDLPDDEEQELEANFRVKLWDLSEFGREKTARKYGYDLSGSGYSSNSAANTSELKPEGFKQTVLYFLYVNFGSYKRNVLDFFDNLVK